MNEDQKITQRYREVPREEPPRHLDEAILAAARRAVKTRPAPLVVPTGRRRWYFPLAAAAVIVLAVAVTMHVERERPGLELAEAPVAAPPPPSSPREEQAAATAQAPAEPAPVCARSEAGAFAGFAREARRRVSRRPAESSEAGGTAAAGRGERRPGIRPRGHGSEAVKRNTAGARPAQAKPAAPMREEARARTSRAPDKVPAVAGALGGFAYASPEQWLQGIADLRRQGRHEEADKALAEFRRAYPDYRISEAMLEKVEKQK